MNLEEFKEIPNYSRYLINENGEVWDRKSCKYPKKSIIDGVWKVQIFKDSGSKRSVAVHTLVFNAFVEKTQGKEQLKHKDGDINNNHYTNITKHVKDKKQSFYQGLGIVGERNLSMKELAYQTWAGMCSRCTNPSDSSYLRYGAAGVSVCPEWNDFNTFEKWFNSNYIKGWCLDKDLIGDSKEYSENSCVFIPRSLNSIIAHRDRRNTVEKYTRGSFTLRTYIASKYVVFKGISEDECIEQLSLVRSLQLEKMLWLMEDYVSKIPNSPQIDLRVIQKIKEMID